MSRAWSAGRIGVLSGVSLLLIGLAGSAISWPLLTSTLGPTAYVFYTHPREEISSLRNASLGHATAIVCGLVALLVTGTWRVAAVAVVSSTTLPQVVSVALAVGASLAVMNALRVNHPPAAASAVLVASGLAAPGRLLGGLVLGLLALLVVQALLNVVPGSPPWDSRGARGTPESS